MSDKNKYNKDFVDKGWEEMSSILDTEMPVNEKKRRYPFFLIIGILALGSLISLWFSINNESNDNEITIAQDVSGSENEINDKTNVILNDIAKEEVVSIIDSEHKVEGDNSKMNTEPKEKSSTVINKKDAITNYSNSFSSSKNYNLNFNKQDLNINYFSTNQKNSEVFIEKIEGKIPSGELRVNNPVEIGINNTGKEEEKMNKELFILKSIIFAGITSLELDGKEVKLDVNKISLGKWKFGIEGGFIFQDKNDMGARLGFVSTRGMNNKLNFHTGLELNSQFINYPNKVVTSILNDLDLNNSSGSIAPIGTAELYSISEIRINSYAVRIPLMIGYEINPSFEITGGAIASYQFYSNSNSGLIPDSSFVMNDDQGFAYNKVSPSLEVLGSLGLMYYPKKNIGIGLRYDHGFINRKITVRGDTSNIQELDLKGYKNKTRQVSLSARMYF